ncbi:MAG: hypothetical protein ACOZBL_00585 [Patescibacteria group bacterium]
MYCCLAHSPALPTLRSQMFTTADLAQSVLKIFDQCLIYFAQTAQLTAQSQAFNTKSDQTSFIISFLVSYHCLNVSMEAVVQTVHMTDQVIAAQAKAGTLTGKLAQIAIHAKILAHKTQATSQA